MGVGGKGKFSPVLTGYQTLKGVLPNVPLKLFKQKRIINFVCNSCIHISSDSLDMFTHRKKENPTAYFKFGYVSMFFKVVYKVFCNQTEIWIY